MVSQSFFNISNPGSLSFASLLKSISNFFFFSNSKSNLFMLISASYLKYIYNLALGVSFNSTDPTMHSKPLSTVLPENTTVFPSFHKENLTVSPGKT